MKIGIIIGRIGGVDGVALETEKWIEILRKLDHQVFIASGKFEIQFKNSTLIPELDFHHPDTEKHQEEVFYNPTNEPEKLCKRLDKEAGFIEKELEKWVQDKNIEIIISENASALPAHITMGMAIYNLVKRLKIPTITHDHDFWWERGERYFTPLKEVEEIIKECFPIRLDWVKHAVINSYCAGQLKTRYQTDSVIIPNVMDFKQEYGLINSKNQGLYKTLGFKKEDILIFQITRIVRRKNIEAAIDLIHKLDHPQIKLVITGNSLDDYKDIYLDELKEMVRKLGIENKVSFSGHIFRAHSEKGTGNADYDLSDAYAQSRALTYFSTYEGFGNAFVEGVLAKKPIFVNNYKPVYWPDIGSKGFETVMIKDGIVDEKSLLKIKEIVLSPKRCQEISEFNFKLGKKLFSYEVLEEKLKNIVDSF